MTDGFGADYTFEATGNVAVMRQAVEAARMAWGLCTVAGVAGKGETLDVVPRLLITGRRIAGSSFGGVKGRDQVPQLVDRYLAGEIDVEPFISHRISPRRSQPRLRADGGPGRDPQRHRVRLRPGARRAGRAPQVTHPQRDWGIPQTPETVPAPPSAPIDTLYTTGWAGGAKPKRDHNVEEARDRDHPLCRRLRRRHAAGRRSLHGRHRARRQRPLDAAGLPGRDPRPGRHPRRRLRLPDPLRLARHPHPGRPPEHAGGDEPGGAQSPPRRRCEAGRHADRQRGRLHRRQPAQGRLRGEPARGRHGRGLPDLQGADDDADHARHRRASRA